MNEIKTTRVDEFRQFKKEIRGSKNHLIVGLDIAKRKHHAIFRGYRRLYAAQGADS